MVAALNLCRFGLRGEWRLRFFAARSGPGFGPERELRRLCKNGGSRAKALAVQSGDAPADCRRSRLRIPSASAHVSEPLAGSEGPTATHWETTSQPRRGR